MIIDQRELKQLILHHYPGPYGPVIASLPDSYRDDIRFPLQREASRAVNGQPAQQLSKFAFHFSLLRKSRGRSAMTEYFASHSD